MYPKQLTVVLTETWFRSVLGVMIFCRKSETGSRGSLEKRPRKRQPGEGVCSVGHIMIFAIIYDIFIKMEGVLSTLQILILK